ncbi:MAG: hypothetical protein BA863_03375 [Desulfovibrio sp. S3730MH75]|nr:MAG: hypothetical protein BA863_03375 [Desulfovibrio sp. S3730MH75]
MKTALNIALSLAVKASPILLLAAVALFFVLSDTPEDSQNIDKDPTEEITTPPAPDFSEVKRKIMTPATEMLETGPEMEPDTEEFVQIGYSDETSKENLEKDGRSSATVTSAPSGNVSKRARTGKSGKRSSPAKKSEPSEKLVSIFIPPVVTAPLMIDLGRSSSMSQTPFDAEQVAPEEQIEDQPIDSRDDMDQPAIETDFVQQQDIEDLILDVYWKLYPIYQGLICQSRDGQTYIPMGEMFDIVRFAIKINKDGAQGWFINEEKVFEFSTHTGEAKVGVRTYTLPQKDFIVIGEEIYLKLEQFNKLFPLGIEFDLSQMILRIWPTIKLPFEIAQERQNNRRIRRAKDGLMYPLQDLDYAALAPPNLRLNTSISHSSSENSEAQQARVSGLYTGDLLFLSSTLYGSTTLTSYNKKTEFKLSGFSYTGERLFDDNQYVTQLTLGDIIPTQTLMGGSGSLERGIKLTNRSKLEGDTDFDTKTFTGKALPGWEVELYRNDQLIGYRLVDEDGTYTFENVDILFGTNRFRIKLYGPQGEEEVREEVVEISSPLKAGDVEYTASITEQSTGVFGEKISKVKTSSDKGSVRLQGNARIGLGQGRDFTMGLTKETLSGRERVFGSAGMDFNVDKYSLNTAIGASTNDAVFLKANLRGAIFSNKRFGLSAEQQIADKYLDSNIFNKFHATLNGDSRYNEDLRATYGATATRTNSRSSDGTKSTVLDTLTGNYNLIGLWGSLSNNLNYTYYETGTGAQHNAFSGNSNYAWRSNEISLRGNIAMRYKDNKFTIPLISGGGTFKVTPKVSTTVQAEAAFTDETDLRLSNTWSLKIADYSPYLTGAVNNKGRYSLIAGVGINFGIDPISYVPTISGRTSSSSGIGVLVYNDTNYNDIFDNGDRPLEGVTVRAVSTAKKAITDENGRALLYRLPVMKKTDIQVDMQTLPDPAMYPQKGTAIVPRKGKVYSFEIPVHRTAQIIGNVYLVDEEAAVVKAQVPIEITDNEGRVKSECATSSDGYFIMERILPGHYTLRVAPDYLEKKGYSEIVDSDIVINNDVTTPGEKNIFIGTPEIIRTLGNAYRRTIEMSSDALLLTDFSNLDEETDYSTKPQTRFTLPQGQDVSTGTLASAAVAEKKPEPTKPEPIYSLIVDVFASEKSAKRAVEFYAKRYTEALKNHAMVYQKQDDGYAVMVRGVTDKKDAKRIAELFLCAFNLEPGTSTKNDG